MKSIVKFTLLLLIALSFSFFAPAVSLTNSFAPPETVSAAKINHGIISYCGAEINGSWVPFISMLQNYSSYRTAVKSDFQDIKNTFGAKTVRIIAHPMHPEWGGVGLDFPNPTAAEKQNLANIIDDAYSKGLTVFLVMIVPEPYNAKHPDTADNFYANNGQTLVSNLYTFWDNIFGGVLASRMNKIYCVDIMGDFDPYNVYGQFNNNTERDNHREWWRRIWPNFHSWFTYIPSSKKTFELIGGCSNPPYFVVQQINWVRAEIQSHGWSEPFRYAFEAYANKSWADGYSNWYAAYYDLFNSAANAAGGWNKILVEEIGSNHQAGDPTNDGAEGLHTFSASFAVIANYSPSVPIGVWCYYDAPVSSGIGLFGLYKTGDVLTQGWWVLPYYWK